MKHIELFESFVQFFLTEAFTGETEGRTAGNKIKMADAGRTVSFDGKTFTSLGKGKWKDQDEKKLSWIELSSMASALGQRTVVFGLAKSEHGIEHLKKQQVTLGPLVKDNKDLIKGKVYCIADPGLGEWNCGYKYIGMKGRNAHIFVSTIESPGSDPVEYAFTQEQIAQIMEDGELAFEK